jgi:hypothetical protein
MDWDWERAEIAFKRAIELNSNHAGVRAYYAAFLVAMGRHDEAVAQMDRAQDLDPFDAIFRYFRGLLLAYGARRLDDAIEEHRSVLRLNPYNPFALSGLVEACWANGMYEEALEATKTHSTVLGVPEEVEVLESGFAEGGFAEAMLQLAESRVARSRTTYVLPNSIARCYIKAGKKQQALDWIERGFEERDPEMPYIGVSQTWDDLRDEPRFQELLHRMNFPAQVIPAGGRKSDLESISNFESSSLEPLARISHKLVTALADLLAPRAAFSDPHNLWQLSRMWPACVPLRRPSRRTVEYDREGLSREGLLRSPSLEGWGLCGIREIFQKSPDRTLQGYGSVNGISSASLHKLVRKAG